MFKSYVKLDVPICLADTVTNHCGTEKYSFNRFLSQARRKHLMIVKIKGSKRTALVGFPPTDGYCQVPWRGYHLPGTYLSWRLSPMTSCVKQVKGTLEPMPHIREGDGWLWGWMTLHCSLTYCCQNNGHPEDQSLPKAPSA